MGLRQIAEADLKYTLEDGVYGFGWPIEITDPSGKQDTVVGYSNDISQAIDPDTGLVVSGRVASVAMRVSTLTALGFSIPEGIADSSKKPWVIDFLDIGGATHKFKIAQSDNDRSLGIVLCLLESYRG